MVKKVIAATIVALSAPEWGPVLTTITLMAGTVIAVKKVFDEFSDEEN